MKLSFFGFAFLLGTILTSEAQVTNFESHPESTTIYQIEQQETIELEWSMSGGYDNAKLYFTYTELKKDSTTGAYYGLTESTDTGEELYEDCDWCSRKKEYTFKPPCLVAGSLITVRLEKWKKRWLTGGWFGGDSKSLETAIITFQVPLTPNITYGPTRDEIYCDPGPHTLSIADANPDPSKFQGVWKEWSFANSEWIVIHRGDTYNVNFNGQNGNPGEGTKQYLVSYERTDNKVDCSFNFDGLYSVTIIPEISPIYNVVEVICDNSLFATCNAPGTFATLEPDLPQAEEQMNRALSASFTPVGTDVTLETVYNSRWEPISMTRTENNVTKACAADLEFHNLDLQIYEHKSEFAFKKTVDNPYFTGLNGQTNSFHCSRISDIVEVRLLSAGCTEGASTTPERESVENTLASNPNITHLGSNGNLRYSNGDYDFTLGVLGNPEAYKHLQILWTTNSHLINNLSEWNPNVYLTDEDFKEFDGNAITFEAIIFNPTTGFAISWKDRIIKTVAFHSGNSRVFNMEYPLSEIHTSETVHENKTREVLPELSDSLNKNTENLNDSEVGLKILVFPNPVNHTLQLKSNSPVKEISIVDLQGQLIKTVFVNNETSVKIEVKDLPKGIFLLYCQDINGNLQTSKWIKL